jgi:RNA polymerase sigma factor (sigma-70 family)
MDYDFVLPLSSSPPYHYSDLLRWSRRCLRRLVGRWHDPDLPEEAAAHVLARLHRYDPQRSPFPHWAYRVMRNYYLSEFRRLCRKFRQFPSSIDPQSTDEVEDFLHAIPDPRPNPYEGTFETLDWQFPFNEHDCRCIRSWSPKEAFVNLAWHGAMWRKLPPDLQRHLLQKVSVKQPFPPQGFEYWEPAQRTTYLAQTLGIKENSIHQHLKRGRYRLLQLQFIRELADYYGYAIAT